MQRSDRPDRSQTLIVNHIWVFEAMVLTLNNLNSPPVVILKYDLIIFVHNGLVIHDVHLCNFVQKAHSRRQLIIPRYDALLLDV